MPNDSHIIQHYTNFWGKVNKISNHADSIQPISILEFEPDSSNQDWVYATVGMSEQPMQYPKDWINEKPERRAELFIYSRQRNDELGNLLSSLANYPFIKTTFFDAGHTIPGTVGVIKNSSLTDILLLPPLGEPPEFEIAHHDEYHVRILWVIPIYNSERQLVLKNGWKSLVDLFFKNQTDTSDLNRGKAI